EISKTNIHSQQIGLAATTSAIRTGAWPASGPLGSWDRICGYPGGGNGRPAGAVAAAGLARDAEAESSQRLGGGRVTRGRVGGVVADQQAARARPDGARQVVPDQVRPARAGHAVEQDVHVVEAHRAGRLPVHGIAGPDAAGTAAASTGSPCSSSRRAASSAEQKRRTAVRCGLPPRYGPPSIHAYRWPRSRPNGRNRW